jgi:hypothetical protein
MKTSIKDNPKEKTKESGASDTTTDGRGTKLPTRERKKKK